MLKFLFQLIAFIAFLYLIAYLITDFEDFCKRKSAITKEWTEKVNNCVLNPNYRSDCSLILYRDMQIHNMDSRQTHSVAPVPIVVR